MHPLVLIPNIPLGLLLVVASILCYVSAFLVFYLFDKDLNLKKDVNLSSSKYRLGVFGSQEFVLSALLYLVTVGMLPWTHAFERLNYELTNGVIKFIASSIFPVVSTVSACYLIESNGFVVAALVMTSVYLLLILFRHSEDWGIIDLYLANGLSHISQAKHGHLWKMYVTSIIAASRFIVVPYINKFCGKGSPLPTYPGGDDNRVTNAPTRVGLTAERRIRV